jgi:hypothetical protein
VNSNYRSYDEDTASLILAMIGLTIPAAPNATTEHRFAMTRWQMTQSGANPSLGRNSLLPGKKQGITAISVSARVERTGNARSLQGFS